MSSVALETNDRAEAASSHGHAQSYLECNRGIMSWLYTVDHKRIGMMYLAAILAFFLVGGIFAVALRTELFFPKPTGFDPKTAGNIMTADSYNQAFTLHGAIMTFLVIIPSIPAALGNFVLPIMLGAKDVAFPRLNLWSFYLYVIGALFFLLTLATSGLDTGWTFYTPYSTTTATAVIAATTGAFILGFSSIFTGINFIVTIHKLRPAGMTWFRMPLFLWALYATAIIQVLATPVLGITLLMLIAERALSIGIFDPKLGGDPVLFQHFFWFYSHPAVYIMILPAMGVVSEIVAVFSRKPIFGYRAIAYSSIAIALLGFLVWGHHMFVSGQSPMAAMIFSALTFSVSIPSAIKVFNWLATMYKGSINLQTPMCYALSFIFLFAIGGLTGLFLGSLATDVHLHDSYFVVAHFHYVMMGSSLMAFVGGMYYWWPKMTGKMYSENWARFACLVVFIGFNMTFFPQFVMGTQGMPRRYFSYPVRFTSFHQLSTIGSYILGLGFCMAAAGFVHSLKFGKRAPANPWGGATLEWECESPPPVENFANTPTYHDPYSYDALQHSGNGAGYLRRETPTANSAVTETTHA